MGSTQCSGSLRSGYIMYLLEKIASFFKTERDVDTKSRSNVEAGKEFGTRCERHATYFDGIGHMFRATVGTGILGLPVAFSQSGYVLGTIGLIFVTYLALYCALMLAQCQLKLAKKDEKIIPSFQGSVQAAFAQGPQKYKSLASFFMKVTNISLLFGQVGGVCVYFIFIAANFKAAVDSIVDIDIRLWTALISVPVLVMSMVVNLRQMSIVSSIGNFVILSSIAIILYYILREPLSFENRVPFGNFRDLPQFFGTAFFANAYINMVLPLQCEMCHPEEVTQRFGVLDMNALLTGSLYLVFGFLGYLRYGNDALGSVTLNLPQGTIGTTVQILLGLSVMTATALQNYITITVIWDDYLDKRITKNKLFYESFLKIVLVLITLAIAVSVPDLELLVSITGILGQVILSTALPCIIHLLTSYEQESFRAYVKEFWLDVVAVLFSIFILATSAGTMTLQIVEKFN